MSIRDSILSSLTTSLSGTSCKVSSELPFESGGVELYNKNMKTVYLSAESVETVLLYSVLGGNDVYQRNTTVTAFLTVDAKNQPQDIESVLSNMQSALLSPGNKMSNESTLETEIEEDKITYILEYTFSDID